MGGRFRRQGDGEDARSVRVAILVATVVLASCATEAQTTVVHSNRSHPKVSATYPPFVNEVDATSKEEREIRSGLPALNARLRSEVFTDFYVAHAEGLPQFKYVVDEALWNDLDPETRSGLVKPGGALFEQTRGEYRRYHRGRICLGNPDNNLMLHVVNREHTIVGLDYVVFVASSEC